MGESKNSVILLVEDDHDIRVAVRQTLEMARYNVLSAPTGADALKILNRHKPDLIILDMVMPVMDGEEFLKAKERDARLADIPVIMISDFEKPLNPESILEKIPQILTYKTNPA